MNETIDKCNKMLRETTNEEADDIKNKLDTIRNQVCDWFSSISLFLFYFNVVWNSICHSGLFPCNVSLVNKPYYFLFNN